LASLRARLQARHPERTLHERAQRLDDLAGRLVRANRNFLATRTTMVEALSKQLDAHSPALSLAASQAKLATVTVRMAAAMDAHIQRSTAKFHVATRALDTVSPLAVLDRGYAVLKKNGDLVTRTDQVAQGEQLVAELLDGRIHATVESTELRPKNG